MGSRKDLIGRRKRLTTTAVVYLGTFVEQLGFTVYSLHIVTACGRGVNTEKLE